MENCFRKIILSGKKQIFIFPHTELGAPMLFPDVFQNVSTKNEGVRPETRPVWCTRKNIEILRFASLFHLKNKL